MLRAAHYAKAAGDAPWRRHAPAVDRDGDGGSHARRSRADRRKFHSRSSRSPDAPPGGTMAG